jgi:hypothetical protein
MVICFNPSNSTLFNQTVLHTGKLVLIAPKDQSPKEEFLNYQPLKMSPL